MATDAAHRIGRDDVVWAFSPDMTPVLEVEPGAIVTLETNDCFTGQIQSEADLVTEIDFARVNSATGPVAVRGAEPGDSLVVELLQVRPAETGFATLIPGIGQLIDRVDAPLTQVFRVEGDTIHMNERISFPLRPMVGVIGVATEHETASPVSRSRARSRFASTCSREAGPVAGDRARRPVGNPRHRGRGFHGGTRLCGRGGCALLPGLSAAGILHNCTRFDPKGVGDTATVLVGNCKGAGNDGRT